MKSSPLGSLLAAILLIGSCASSPPDPRVSGPSVVSSFFKPEEGVIYRYGKFCGPSVPLTDAQRDQHPEQSEGRITLLRAEAPVDSLDAACKAHDLCYEKYGHDLFSCDAVFDRLTAYAYSPAFDSTPRMRSACGKLASELNNGVVCLKGKKTGTALDQTLARANQAYCGGAVNAIAAGPDLLLESAFGGGGFPKEEGLCHFTDQDRRQREVRALIELRLAHAISKCSTRRGKQLGYLASVDLSRFPECAPDVEESKRLTRADLYR